MKRLFVIVCSVLLAGGAYAQGWGAWGSETPAKDTKSGETTGGTAGETPAAAAKETPKLVTPTIGTHYDDAPEAHYEPPHTPNDGRISITENVVVPYPYLREADVKFKRRVWRRIDTRQKMNKSFTWPGSPVTQVLYELAVKGKVKAYENDSFASYYTPEEAFERGADFVVTQIPDPRFPDDPDNMIDTTYWDPFRWDKIIKFEIMEDWIFDYKHSEMRPRIIGIAPLMTKSVMGISIEVPLFWLKMDDIRPTLAKSEVYNRYNDVMRMSWDDLFNHYRMFDSYIVKTTDWDNRYINQKPEFMQDGVAALIEGEKIKNDLFIFEHDLWEY
jgi:gliding motility associated protien GldN